METEKDRKKQLETLEQLQKERTSGQVKRAIGGGRQGRKGKRVIPKSRFIIKGNQVWDTETRRHQSAHECCKQLNIYYDMLRAVAARAEAQAAAAAQQKRFSHKK